MERLAGRIILLWGGQRRLAAALAGAVASLGLAPVDFPAAGFVAFPVLVWLLDGGVATGRVRQLSSAFGVGWWFGFGYFLAGLWWIGAAFLADNGSALWALPLAVLGLPALLAVFYGLATFAASLLWRDGAGRIAALAFGFGAAEWLRSIFSAGLAWNAIGYVAMPLPVFMQAAQLVGIFGISTLAVFVFSAPALIGTHHGARPGLTFAGLLAAGLLGYGYASLLAAGPPDRFLQARIVQIGSRSVGSDDAFQAYLELTAASSANEDSPPQLILWPELAVPAVLAERPDLLEEVGEVLKEGQALIAGTIRDEESGTGERRLYDAVVAIDDRGGIGDAADRAHPWPFTSLLRYIGIERGLPANVSAASGERLSLPEEMRAIPLFGGEAVIPGIGEGDAGDADLIVNLADYARVSGTPGPYQHLRHAQLRAVESGLPLLLAMPNGVSAAIDAQGRIIDAFATGSRGALDVSLPIEKSNFFDIVHFGMGNINVRGLTFVIFFGMLPLLLSTRGRSN